MTFAEGPGRMPIEAITVGNRHRKVLGNIDRLASSIGEIGLLQPVVVDIEGRLIAGQRRLLACVQLGWKDIPVHVVSIERIIHGEAAENIERDDFTQSALVGVGQTIEPEIRDIARQRQLAALRRGTQIPVPKSLRNGEVGEARELVAAFLGISWLTLERATKVVEASERDPDRYGHLVEEMDRTGKVNGVYKRLLIMEKAAAIRAEPPPLPTGPFRVIVADPPWSYGDRVDDPSHRAANPYPPMSIEAICGMPIGDLALDDAVLWLWTTNAHMREAFAVLDAWGFAHKTILTWVKDRMGTGDWLRGQTEHCLMAVRGKPVVQLTNQTTVLHAPMQEHSRKPDEFYALVEALCPGAKVELFARRERPGWAAHGDEVGGDAGL